MRILCLLACLAIAGACNSTALHVERKSSGAVERDPEFDPVPGSDGHYISLPAYPFVNCTDALMPAQLAQKDGNWTELHGVSQQTSMLISDDEHVHTHVAATPCETARRYTDFQGYARDVVDPAKKVCSKAQASWVTIRKELQLKTLRQLASEYCLDVPEALKQTWPKSEFSFIQMSDVQIREPSAKLGSSKLSRQLKHIESSFEQDYEQEQYAMFVYDAVIETINKELDYYQDEKLHTPNLEDWQRERIAPSLMIHTGDSVDMGLRSEFDTFINYSDKLKIPWYQAIGNHDVLAFGNLTLSSGDGKIDGDDPDHMCEGSLWRDAKRRGIHCTCTSLAALIREENARRVDNRGALPDLPARIFSLFPILVKRICLIHKIDGDRFVMDPYLDDAPSTSDLYPAAADRYPIRSFINAHNASFNDAVQPVVRESYARHTSSNPCAELGGPGTGPAPEWGFHGFNLEWLFDAKWAGKYEAKSPETRRLGGYYCFQMGTLASDAGKAAGDRRKIWGVVLNTTIEAGAYGEVGDCQQEWLESVLGEGPTKTVPGCPFDFVSTQIGPKDLVFVFSHHPLWSIYDKTHRERLIRTLTTSPNVVALFSGHTHHPELRVQWPLEPVAKNARIGHPLWEVIAASLIDYPQQGRQITLKTWGDLGYFEILSFSPTGNGPSAEKVKAAERGAIRDKCELNPELCDGPGRIRLPGRNVTFPRIFFRMPGATSGLCRVPHLDRNAELTREEARPMRAVEPDCLDATGAAAAPKTPVKADRK